MFDPLELAVCPVVSPKYAVDLCCDVLVKPFRWDPEPYRTPRGRSLLPSRGCSARYGLGLLLPWGKGCPPNREAQMGQ
eukprot:scaffold76272_cov31-Tisochrysis_lutea.AAC.3